MTLALESIADGLAFGERERERDEDLDLLFDGHARQAFAI